MVRKTKEEALATRAGILDAAERLFQAQGVSGTSLHDIASAAGVTRGAIYWHFKDKSDLFNAMMKRVCLPMEEAGAQLGQAGGRAPLQELRAHVAGIFERVVGDAQVRRVFQIATQKVEYVDELSAVLERHLQRRRDYLAILERTLRAAQGRGEIAPAPPALESAIGLHALIDGLIQNWMLEPATFDLQVVGARTLELLLTGLARHPLAPA
jgi:TetR/AcrR family acrAB operon transcriptional repressor